MSLFLNVLLRELPDLPGFDPPDVELPLVVCLGDLEGLVLPRDAGDDGFLPTTELERDALLDDEERDRLIERPGGDFDGPRERFDGD